MYLLLNPNHDYGLRFDLIEEIIDNTDNQTHWNIYQYLKMIKPLSTIMNKSQLCGEILMDIKMYTRKMIKISHFFMNTYKIGIFKKNYIAQLLI